MAKLLDIAQTVEAAHAFVEKGWEPIPLQPKGKNPKGPWKTPITWDEKQLATEFSPNDNIGVALGERSNGLIDIDFDWPEAAKIADVLFADLPSFGRASSARSHRIAHSNLSKGRLLFQLPSDGANALLAERTTVMEIRGSGHQTMFPPSIHPTGEVVRWDREPDDIPELEQTDLERRGGLCAALAVVLKAYPKVPGDRDNVCLALTGALIRAGLDDNAVDRLVAMVAQLAGDEEASKRGGKSAASRTKVEADEPAWGLPELCNRLGIAELEPTIRKWLGGAAISTEVRTSREISVLPGEIPAAVDEAEQALVEGNAGIYQRGETLVRVARLNASQEEEGVRRPVGTINLIEVAQPWLLEQFARAANWFLPGKKGFIRVDPPSKIATAYRARVGEWRVPSLLGIVQAPTLRSDGSLLQAPGYDERSRLLYDNLNVRFPPIAENPSYQDAVEALSRLAHPFREFSFGDEASRSVTLVAILTTLVRGSLPTAPMFAFDAPAAGTGKSLLAETISVIATGHRPAMMAQGANSEEDQKRLSSVLMAGDPIIVIDNCEKPIGGEFLCSMLTQEIVQARVLGKSQMVRLPQKSVVMATGNNLIFAGDMTRRAIVCRLDAGVERPESRQFQFDPREEVARDRASLVAAGLTVLRAYIAAGKPCPVPKLGSFEDWNYIREALVWLGMEDPVATQERLMSSDPCRDEVAEILTVWRSAYGGAAVRLKDLAAELSSGSTDARRNELADLLRMMSNQHQFNAKSVGRTLAKHIDRIVSGLVLRARGDSSGKVYWVEQASGEESPRQGLDQEEMPF